MNTSLIPVKAEETEGASAGAATTAETMDERLLPFHFADALHWEKPPGGTGGGRGGPEENDEVGPYTILTLSLSSRRVSQLVHEPTAGASTQCGIPHLTS